MPVSDWVFRYENLAHSLRARRVLKSSMETVMHVRHEVDSLRAWIRRKEFRRASIGVLELRRKEHGVFRFDADWILNIPIPRETDDEHVHLGRPSQGAKQFLGVHLHSKGEVLLVPPHELLDVFPSHPIPQLNTARDRPTAPTVLVLQPVLQPPNLRGAASPCLWAETLARAARLKPTTLGLEFYDVWSTMVLSYPTTDVMTRQKAGPASSWPRPDIGRQRKLEQEECVITDHALKAFG